MNLKKYPNEKKSKLYSGAIMLPHLSKDLIISDKTTAEEVVHWFSLLIKQFPYSSIKQIVEEKITEALLSTSLVSRETWKSPVYKNDIIPSIIITDETTVEDFGLWLSKHPRAGEENWNICVEGMDAFMKIKRVAKMKVA